MPELATDKVFPNKKCGGISYTAVVQPMGFEIQSMLWDLMSNYYSDRAGRQGADIQLGTVRDAVLYNGIKKLEVEGKEITLGRNYALIDLPKYADREYRRKMPNTLLEHVVEVNDFLGFEEPFNMIFGQYLPEHLRGKPDPTESDGETRTDSPDTLTPEQEETQEQKSRVPAVQ